MFDLQNHSIYIILKKCLCYPNIAITRKGAIMIALQITNTKQIMNALLVAESFDTFQMEEVTITTYNTFHMDGHMVKEFYSAEEIENSTDSFPEFSSWKDIRPICFQLIKGKRTPVSFRFVLHASPNIISEIANADACEVAENLIRSLILNIRYENGRVTCITGTSFTTFLMDKSVEQLWDKYVRNLFSQLGLEFEEI